MEKIDLGLTQYAHSVIAVSRGRECQDLLGSKRKMCRP